jgi:shikimate dehydrogenase
MDTSRHYAVFGHPVAHSLSPRIHAAFGRQAGIELRYDAIDAPPERFFDLLQAFADGGGLGANVTLPLKESAFALAASTTVRARRAGAVNTLARIDGGWLGDNTDGEGLVRDLRDNQRMPVAGKRVLLLGAGGAARGALAPLLSEKPAELVISSRTPWVVEKLAAEFKPLGPVRPSTHLALKGERFDLVLNATSAGHHGQVPRLPEKLLSPGAACYDLSYGKAFEPFRAWATAAGAARVADGLGMLVEQAAVCFELWRGTRPETVEVIKRLRTGTTS